MNLQTYPFSALVHSNGKTSSLRRSQSSNRNSAIGDGLGGPSVESTDREIEFADRCCTEPHFDNAASRTPAPRAAPQAAPRAAQLVARDLCPTRLQNPLHSCTSFAPGHMSSFLLIFQFGFVLSVM